MKRTLSPSQREAILERDDYVCVYCLGDANCVDHVIPFCWSQCDEPDNLVACCNECNQIAGGLIFDDFDLKTEYIRTVRQGKKWSKRLKKKMGNRCTECHRYFRPLYRGATLFVCFECVPLVCPPMEDYCEKIR